MHKYLLWLSCGLVFLFGLLFLHYAHVVNGGYMTIDPMITSVDDVQKLCANNVLHVQALVQDTELWLRTHVQKFLEIPENQRTFENTARALDEINYQIYVTSQILDVLRDVSDDILVREHAREGGVKFQQIAQELVLANPAVFSVFADYVKHRAKKEILSDEERYFLSETLREYERNGLLLSQENFDRVKILYDETKKLNSAFNENIDISPFAVPCTVAELDGLPGYMRENLARDAQGRYLVDYPTAFSVLAHVNLGETRKKIYRAIKNRAYPQNYPLLERIIVKNDARARLLGFDSYAAYDVANQIAVTPKAVQNFLASLYGGAQQKQIREWALLIKNLPQSVHLTPDGKINAWDLDYAKEQFKRQQFGIDDGVIAQYFPIDYVIKRLFDICQQFFGLIITPVEGVFWHPSVQCFSVHGVHDHVSYGYLVLDLHARPHKYAQGAAAIDVVPARRAKNGARQNAVVVVIANCPALIKDNPVLLRFAQLKTLFHEFGHAMQGLVGSSLLAGFAETNAKVDFFEFPSQMFELWLDDPVIVRMISKHYQTGDPLSEDQISRLLRSEKSDIGDYTLHELAFSDLSLTLFLKEKPNIQQTYRKIMNYYCPYVVFDDQDHMPAGWGILADFIYGSKYYSYLWSKVYALDIYQVLKSPSENS